MGLGDGKSLLQRIEGAEKGHQSVEDAAMELKFKLLGLGLGSGLGLGTVVKEKKNNDSDRLNQSRVESPAPELNVA